METLKKTRSLQCEYEQQKEYLDMNSNYIRVAEEPEDRLVSCSYIESSAKRDLLWKQRKTYKPYYMFCIL